MAITSIGTPSGRNASTCGYCSQNGDRSATASNTYSASFSAQILSCEAYQTMLDRGWRRAGTWCYKPNLRTTCCPQYTIRLDALAFKPSKTQRKVVNRWNRYVTHDATQEIMDSDTPAHKHQKVKVTPTFSLKDAIHYSEQKDANHKFKVILEPSSYTDEKYELYQNYQETIHNDKNSSPSGFKRFLVDSPLQTKPITYTSPPPSHVPINYGSYHQLYRLDGQLIAMSVLDILPSCVSSVYFMYDKTWESFSLGKLSALREASLALEIHEAGAPEVKYLYMGYYIHTCQKMRYKADYTPSYLADPETYEWFPLDICRRSLERHRYACFSHPENSIVGLPDPEALLDNTPPSTLDDDDLDKIQVIIGLEERNISVVPINITSAWKSEIVRDEVTACVAALGMNVAKDTAFLL